MSKEPSNGGWSPVRCAHCQQIIGLYEPLIVVAPSGPRESSLVADPGLGSLAMPRLHRGCAQASGLVT